MKPARKREIVLPVFGALLLLMGVTTESLGQSRRSTTREPILRGNPYRDAGGSCVYGKDGKLVYAPKGKRCRDGSDHLGTAGDAQSPILAGYPPARRDDLAKLLSDYEHLVDEVARLRMAVDAGNRPVALEVADKIRSELTAHRAREERFLEKMAPRSTEP